MHISNSVKQLGHKVREGLGGVGLVVRDLLAPTAVVIVLISLGVSGYVLIEGWGALDALYMTVITLATIGYGETHPLSPEGRLFTIILIVLGALVMAVVFGVFTQKIVQRQFLIVFHRKKMVDAIHRLERHTIVCGYGRLSKIAAEELRREGCPLVVIEQDPFKVELAERAGLLVTQGDATNEETLIAAGIKRAKSLVSLLPNDADNLYVILTSRELRPDLYIVSRSEDDTGEKRLRRAGADRVMSPYRAGGLKIAGGLLRPLVTDFLDLAASANVNLQIEEIQIPAGSPLTGRSLQDAEVRRRTNVIVAAIISSSGEMLFNPDGATVIQSGATFIALGRREELSRLEQLVLGEAA